MKFKALHICEICLVDARSNTLSLINLIEDVQLHGIPSIIPKLATVILIEKENDEEEDEFEVRLNLTINGNSILSHPVNCNFRGGKKTRSIVEFNSVPLKEVGNLIFNVTHNEIEVLTKELQLTLPEAPQVNVNQP